MKILKKPDSEQISKLLSLIKKAELKLINISEYAEIIHFQIGETVYETDWFKLLCSPDFLNIFWPGEVINLNRTGQVPEKINKWKWIRNYMIEESDKGIHPIDFLYFRLFEKN